MVYVIQEMMPDLLHPEGMHIFSRQEAAELEPHHSSRYNVMPQSIKKFKKMTRPDKSVISFKEDEAKCIISNAMTAESNMISLKVQHTQCIADSRNPTLDDFVIPNSLDLHPR